MQSFRIPLGTKQRMERALVQEGSCTSLSVKLPLHQPIKLCVRKKGYMFAQWKWSAKGKRKKQKVRKREREFVTSSGTDWLSRDWLRKQWEQNGSEKREKQISGQKCTPSFESWRLIRTFLPVFSLHPITTFLESSSLLSPPFVQRMRKKGEKKLYLHPTVTFSFFPLHCVVYTWTGEGLHDQHHYCPTNMFFSRFM